MEGADHGKHSHGRGRDHRPVPGPRRTRDPHARGHGQDGSELPSHLTRRQDRGGARGTGIRGRGGKADGGRLDVMTDKKYPRHQYAGDTMVIHGVIPLGTASHPKPVLHR